jgi:hypothetical protein
VRPGCCRARTGPCSAWCRRRARRLRPRRLASRVAERLGPRLPAGGVDLAVVGAQGPGEAVPLARRRRWRRS